MASGEPRHLADVSEDDAPIFFWSDSFVILESGKRLAHPPVHFVFGQGLKLDLFRQLNNFSQLCDTFDVGVVHGDLHSALTMPHGSAAINEPSGSFCVGQDCWNLFYESMI